LKLQIFKILQLDLLGTKNAKQKPSIFKFTRKGQPLKVVFCFVIKGVGLELRSALQLQGKAEAKSSLSCQTSHFFLGGVRGFT